MRYKKIHFVGIKGVGMTPLAVIAKEAGCEVSGSDVIEDFITSTTLKKAGITPQVGFKPSNITDPDLVITTGAHGGYNNIEVQTARERQIPIITTGQAVGLFMEGTIFGQKYTGISIAGSHGKTTTSAMIATLFSLANLKPSYVVGTSEIIPLGSSGHFGKGKYFIAEADEYANEPKMDKTAKFLFQHPKIIVITNIEYDHPDIYESIDAVCSVFRQFIDALSEDGVVIACIDNEEVQKVLSDYKGNVITYGFSKQAEYRITRVSVSGEQTFFWVDHKGESLGEFAIRVSGEHNALNALAASITASYEGIPWNTIKKTIREFRGTKRRLEYVGQLTTGAYVFDDYAHHPTEIRNSLHALRLRYPKGRILCVFQPHTYSRTKSLFSEFAKAFSDANAVIVTDIYASQREAKDPSVSSELLVAEAKKTHFSIQYKASLTDVIEYLKSEKLPDTTILVTMGAGDIYKILEKLSFLPQ